MSEASPARVTLPQEHVLRVMIGLWQSRSLAAAVELELADALAEGPLHVDALAARTRTHADSLFRLLRALESIGIFRQVSPRVFANNPSSDCLRRNAPGSQWSALRLILSAGCGQYEAWNGITASIRTGNVAFNEVHGQSCWEFFKDHPDASAVFNQAMRSLTAPMTPLVTAALDWSGFPVIADIGGGVGAQLVDILDAHPDCRGVLFDQPEVLAEALPHARMERVGGNFFESVPAGADVYIMRWIIHDWPEPEVLRILNNVRQAMPQPARLVLIEDVIPETPQFSFGKWSDLHMLAQTGGRERTASEYRELLGQAGLELERIISTPAPLSLLVGRAAL